MKHLLILLSATMWIRFDYAPESDGVNYDIFSAGFETKKDIANALRDTIQKMEASSTPVDTMALRAFKRELEEYNGFH